MTAYDAAMAVVIVLGMIWGAWRGVTWQIASIASLVVGYLVAHPASAQVAPYMPGDPTVARAIGMIVVYAAVSGGIFLLAWMVRATLRRLRFEAYDRHLGMVLGGLEGGLLGIVVTMFVVSLAPSTRGPIFASPAGHVVGQVMSAVGPVLPAEFRKVLSPFLSGAQASADSTTPSATETQQAEPLTRVAMQPSEATQPSLGGLINQAETKVGNAASSLVVQQLEQFRGSSHDANARPR